MRSMTVLALDVDAATLWQVLLVVVAVVVVGVVALITTLLFLVRSISTSIRQLREVAVEQAAQVQAQGTEVTVPESSQPNAEAAAEEASGRPVAPRSDKGATEG